MTTPYPTLQNLSIEWALTGDDNQNGVVTVRYRKLGLSNWLTGMPLRRIPAGSAEGFSWANRHSGSVLDLKPGTTYEIELKLTDPDGGSTTKVITASTRSVPRAAAGATVRSVTPSSFAAAASAALPGDILQLAAGSYSGFSFPQSGTEQAPIVIRGVDRSAVVINGDARFDGRSHVFLENVTVKGTVRIDNTTGVVVRRCLVQTNGNGVVAYGPATGAYVADNTILGPTPWTEDAQGAHGKNLGEGIELTGPGNIIAYNYVKGFRDCISTMEDSHAKNQVSVDVYNNDIEVGSDDAIEVDFTMGNCRVLRNRITNAFVGISSQPGLGGPAYFIRNVMYNVIYEPFKLHRGSVGDIGYHNTVIKCGDGFSVFTGTTWSRADFRNNLFIGGTGGGTYGGYSNGNGAVASLSAADGTCRFDHNGYGSIGTGTFRGRIGAASFSSLAELKSKTTEKNACQVDLSVFVNQIAFPSYPFPQRAIPDLRIKGSCAVTDRGQLIPNVNQGYLGAGPDLGAYEAGQLLPHYGPRSSEDQHLCGNGDREGPEECDDGNLVSGDGCSSSCTWEVAGGSVTPPPPPPDMGQPAPDSGPPTPDLRGPAQDASQPDPDAAAQGPNLGGAADGRATPAADAAVNKRDSTTAGVDASPGRDARLAGLDGRPPAAGDGGQAPAEGCNPPPSALDGSKTLSGGCRLSSGNGVLPLGGLALFVLLLSRWWRARGRRRR